MKVTTYLFCLFIGFISFSQYEQPPGQPCFFEYYRMEDPECSVIPPEQILRDTVFYTDAATTFLDNSGEVIFELFVDSSAADPEVFWYNNYYGRISPSTKYTVYHGTRLLSSTYPYVSTNDIETWIEGTVTNEYQFTAKYGYGESYFLVDNETNDTSAIVIEELDSLDGEPFFTYAYLTGVNEITCTPERLEVLYSDSLFYDDLGRLIQRKRHNEQSLLDIDFDFESYYTYNNYNDIKSYYQIDYEGDTSQLEIRYYNGDEVLDSVYRKTYGFCEMEEIFTFKRDAFNQITERITTTIGGCFFAEGVTKEFFTYNEITGDWTGQTIIDKYGDTTKVYDQVTKSDNGTYNYRRLFYNPNIGYRDTTLYETIFRTDYFTEFEFNLDLFATSQIISDLEGNYETTFQNRLDSYGQLTYSEVINYLSDVNGQKTLSDSIVYTFNEEELLTRRVYRYDVNTGLYPQHSENIYYCHGETVGTLGLTNESTSININVFPNPAKNTLYIESEETINKIEILSLNGSLISSSIEVGNFIDISNLDQGIFIIRIISNSGIGTRTFVKE